MRALVLDGASFVEEEFLEEEPIPIVEETEEEIDVERSSNIVSILVIISRITGFFRTSAQAWALGAYGLASAYTVANNLPNLLYELVMGGMLITAFLPVYISVRNKSGREGANAYTSNLLSIALVMMVLLAVVSFIFAVPIVWTQSAGASSDFDSDLSVWFFRWFCISIVFYALSSIFSGVLNAEREYVWSNIAPIFNNIILIGSFALFGYLTSYAGVLVRDAVLVLAIGSPLGVATQVLMQVPALKRIGVKFKLHIDLHDPALKETVSIALPTLIIMLVSTPTTAVTSSCALSVTAAGASIAYYARVWYVLPYSVFAIPISVTMFTELSNCYMKQDIEGFKGYLSDGTRKIFFTLIPMAMFLMVFAQPLIAVFATGNFTGESAELTVGYLQALALALPFYGLMSFLQKVCSSMMRMNFFMIATCIGTVIQIAICVLLTPHWGLYVVPVSSTFFYGAIDVVTLWSIRRELGNIGMKSVVVSIIKSLALGALGSIVGFGIYWLLVRFVGPCEGVMRGVLYAAAGGLPALIVTYGAATLLGIHDAPFFDALFSRVLRVFKKQA